MEITRTSSILGIVGPRSRSWRNFEIVLHLPQYKLYDSTLVQARKLIIKRVCSSGNTLQIL